MQNSQKRKRYTTKHIDNNPKILMQKMKMPQHWCTSHVPPCRTVHWPKIHFAIMDQYTPGTAVRQTYSRESFLGSIKEWWMHCSYSARGVHPESGFVTTLFGVVSPVHPDSILAGEQTRQSKAMNRCPSCKLHKWAQQNGKINKG